MLLNGSGMSDEHVDAHMLLARRRLYSPVKLMDTLALVALVTKPSFDDPSLARRLKKSAAACQPSLGPQFRHGLYWTSGELRCER